MQKEASERNRSDRRVTFMPSRLPAALRREADSRAERGRCVITVETYPGVNDSELAGALRTLNPALFVDTRETLCTKEELRRCIQPFLTDDRVFGRMYYGEFSDFQIAEATMHCAAA